MGTFGAPTPQGILPGDQPTGAPRPTALDHVKPGGLAGLLGGLGGGIAGGLAGLSKILAYGPFIPQANANLARRQAKDDQDRRYKQAVIDKTLAPEGPTALERNFNFLSGRDPALADSYLSSQANPMGAIEVTDPATGATSMRFYPKGGIPGGPVASPQSMNAAAAIPPSAAAYLKQNPNLRAQFEAKYGAGSAASILGN